MKEASLWGSTILQRLMGYLNAFMKNVNTSLACEVPYQQKMLRYLLWYTFPCHGGCLEIIGEQGTRFGLLKSA